MSARSFCLFFYFLGGSDAGGAGCRWDQSLTEMEVRSASTLAVTQKTALLNRPTRRQTMTKRVIVTPAVYPRLVEFLHFDIQSTGQKSHCIKTV